MLQWFLLLLQCSNRLLLAEWHFKTVILLAVLTLSPFSSISVCPSNRLHCRYSSLSQSLLQCRLSANIKFHGTLLLHPSAKASCHYEQKRTERWSLVESYLNVFRFAVFLFHWTSRPWVALMFQALLFVSGPSIPAPSARCPKLSLYVNLRKAFTSFDMFLLQLLHNKHGVHYPFTSTEPKMYTLD